MAKIILVNIGNSLDDSNYSKVIIVPEGYTVQDVQSGIDCGDIVTNLDKEYSGEFVRSITETKGNYCAFTEDDYLTIETTLKDLRII